MVEVAYHRPPDDTRRYRQELLLDGEDVKITLLHVPAGADPRDVGGAVTLEPGAALLWYTFPGRWHEVAAFHGPDGRLLGHYTNIVRPPRLDRRRWHIDDLFLDVWQPAGGEPEVLDREELRRALAEGWIGDDEAERARQECRRVLERAASGHWPPEAVLRWPLASVPVLRLRRDEPGTYYANLVSGRLIAFGIYFLGAASLTSLAFAAGTDALEPAGRARPWWLGAMAVEAAGLLAGTLAGRLPAVRRLEPREVMDENTLFLGAAVTGAAVLVVNDSALWETLLVAVYGSLALFLGVFAACRLAFDRKPPWLAGAGLAVCAAGLALLL